MKYWRDFLSAVIAAASWAVGYFVTLTLGKGMGAVSAYAPIVGWWLTAYISSSLALRITAVIPLFIGYLGIFLIVTISGQPWFYRDATSLTLPATLVIGLAQALTFCSPLLFDGLIRLVIRIWLRKRKNTTHTQHHHGEQHLHPAEPDPRRPDRDPPSA
jgi:hypothetical protein